MDEHRMEDRKDFYRMENRKEFENKTKRNLSIFIAVTLLCGWFGKLIDSILTKQPEGNSLGMLIWLAAPFLTAVVLRFSRKDLSGVLGMKPHIRNKIGYYAIAVLTFPVISILCLALARVTKAADFSNFSLSGFLCTYGSWLIYNCFRNILEEGAFRGFLTERLIKLKWSDRKIYVVVTLVWGSWHIPYYLFYLDTMGKIKMIISSYIILFCWSILFTEIYRITENIWPALLLHAFANALQYTMMENYIRISDKWNLLFSPVNGVISLLLCVVIGILIRKERISRSLIAKKNEL